MQIKLDFTALITEIKGKPTTPNVANRVDAFVMSKIIATFQVLRLYLHPN
jgi:hypothetical protein